MEAKTVQIEYVVVIVSGNCKFESSLFRQFEIETGFALMPITGYLIKVMTKMSSFRKNSALEFGSFIYSEPKKRGWKVLQK